MGIISNNGLFYFGDQLALNLNLLEELSCVDSQMLGMIIVSRKTKK
jgi:hypothetical protein